MIIRTVRVYNDKKSKYRDECFEHLIENGIVRISAIGTNISKAVYVSNMIRSHFDVGYQVSIKTRSLFEKNGDEMRSSLIKIILFNEEKIGKELLSLSHLLGKGEDYGCYMGCLPLPETSLDGFQSSN